MGKFAGLLENVELPRGAVTGYGKRTRGSCLAYTHE